MDKNKCNSCGKPKCSCKNKEFTKAVIEINNPEQIVLFRKVIIPASMGDDTTVPPAIGKYRNVLLVYEANNHAYLYSSDGIPTLLTSDVAQDLEQKIDAVADDLQAEIENRTDADNHLGDRIDTVSGDLVIETDARQDADTALDGRLTTVEGIAATALQPEAIDKVVMTDISLSPNTSTTTVQIDGAKENLLTGATTTKNIPLPVASHTEAGVMNSATFDAVTNNSNNINALMNGAVAITGLSANPSQSDLTTAWEVQTGLTTLMNRAGIYDVTNNKVWTYYSNDTTWYAASNTSQVTINTFTNSSEGTILGSTNVGQIFAENDGTGSVNGWDALSGAVSTNTSNITSLQTAMAGKQDKLTAGANITISPSNVISATNTTYTAGNAITIENNTINADIYPADFFTNDATDTATGANITLDKTIPTTLKSVELNGDTGQNGTPTPDNPVNVQTVTGEQAVKVSGKNLLGYDYASLKAANPTTAARTWDDATKTMTFYNVTYKVNDDGSITVNGTASGVASYFYLTDNLSLKVGSEYILNGCPSGGSVSGYSLRLYDGSSYRSDFGSGLDFTFGTQSGIRINVSNGTTVNNMVIKPMVRLASDSDPTYEPYVSQSYTLDLGSVELCKIDTYQDYIYKSGNDWYIHKEIGKVILTGSADETWSGGNNNIYFFHVIAGAYQPENRSTIAAILCDYYTPRTYNQVASTTIDYGVALDSNNAGRLAIRNKDCANVTALKAWLASNNTTVYYALVTPTDTKITDADLIADLNALAGAKSYLDVTNFTVTATGTNLPALLKPEAYVKSLYSIIELLNSFKNNLVVVLPNGMTTYPAGEAPLTLDKALEAFQQGRSIFFVDYAAERTSIYTVSAVDVNDGIWSMKVERIGVNASENAGYWIIGTSNTTQWRRVDFYPNINITMQTTDPGEGSPLAANNFIAVYNAS